MKISFITLLCFTLISVQAQAQNVIVQQNQVDSLIKRCLDARGGEAALRELKTISRHGTISFYNQPKINGIYRYRTDIVYPIKLREQIKGMKVLVDRGTNGITFWSWSGAHYKVLDDIALKTYMRNTAEQANRDILWLKDEMKNIHIAVKSPVWAPENSQCLTGVEKSKQYYFCFSESTGLTNAKGWSEECRLISDWRNLDYIKEPYRISHYKNGLLMYEVQLDKAVLDKAIDDKQFLALPDPSMNKSA